MGLGTDTAVEDYEHIWSGDPALDSSGDDFEHRYKLYLDDRSEEHLKFVNGKEPLRWVLRHVSRRIARRILDSHAGKGQEACFDAAAFGLVSVKNLRGPDGKPASLDHVRDERGYERVTDADMDALDEMFPGLVNELGSLVIGKAFPSPK